MNDLTFVPSQCMGMFPFVGRIGQFHPQCVGFCVLGFSLGLGGKSNFWRGFLFVFQICLTALFYDSLKILCQNYDKFIFCRWWKPEIRYKILKNCRGKKRDYVADNRYKLIWFYKYSSSMKSRKISIFSFAMHLSFVWVFCHYFTSSNRCEENCVGCPLSFRL